MIGEELASLWKIAFPIIMTSLLFYSKSIISMYFLGQISDTALAAGSLAISFANIIGYSVLKGLATGMDPICYQAFGAKKWSVLTQTYRKTLCLLLLVSIPITLLWLKMEPILLWLGQDKDLTAVAQVYITYSIPELLAQAHLHPLRTFLRTQNINRPLTLAAIGAMILHYPINYFLVMYLELGVKGVALASALNTINTNLSLLVYLLLSQKALKPWDGALTNTFSEGWQQLFALAGPSVLSVCLEWWWYEIMSIMCGWLSNPKANVAAMGILIQTTSLLYAVTSSLSSSLSTLVGHELGAYQPIQAQQTTSVGLIVAGVWGVLAFSLTIGVKDSWGKLYTSDPSILSLTSSALPILGLCELGNCPQTAACGILMSSARPKIGCLINFVSFYVIGLPIAALLGFKFQMGFVGLWYGLAAAQASCMCMMVYTIVRTDWVHQAKRAKELTQAAHAEENDSEASLVD